MSKTLFDTCVFWSCVTRCRCRTTQSTLFTVNTYWTKLQFFAFKFLVRQFFPFFSFKISVNFCVVLMPNIQILRSFQVILALFFNYKLFTPIYCTRELLSFSTKNIIIAVPYTVKKGFPYSRPQIGMLVTSQLRTGKSKKIFTVYRVGGWPRPSITTSIVNQSPAAACDCQAVA